MGVMYLGHGDRACRFCGISVRKYSEAYDQPVSESENFFAMASIGGFVPGWTLVCPKKHHLNLAGLYETAEFMDFSAKVADTVARAYSEEVVVFEHGCQHPGSLTGCGADHAHLHLVPFSGSLEAAVRQYDFSDEWIETGAGHVDRLLRGKEYLLMSQSVQHLKTGSLVRVLETPRSQYFRSALGNALGLRHVADYHGYPLIELAARTATRLRAEFQVGSGVSGVFGEVA